MHAYFRRNSIELSLASAIRQVGKRGVFLESGEKIAARAVVVATEGPEAARLTEQLAAPASRSMTALYFAAERVPIITSICPARARCQVS